MKHIVFALVTVIFWSCKPVEEKNHVLLISFDGFRHDYVSLYDTPNFDDFIRDGAAATSLTSSFPSKTFPNHYTLVTGLYPGNHGLVDNVFYDKKTGQTYSPRNRILVEDPSFYGGLPLWQLVQQHGMKSASYFWVGSEAPVAGRFPDYYYRYDGAVPDEQRIRQTMDWFELPEAERPQFVSLYFSLVDSQGHDTGPESEETGEVVEEADRLLGMIMAGIEKLDIGVNVIVTSDHGMYPVKSTEDYILELPGFFDLDREGIKVIIQDTHVHLYVKDATLKDELLGEIKAKASHFQVYVQSETPEKWNYRTHERIGDVLLIAEPGYVFSDEIVNTVPDIDNTRGVHGYDPYTTPEMGGIFYANGPRIGEGLKINAFQNVHVYPFITRVLGIEAPPTDGDPEVLEIILKE